jgi:hypothetical protein
LEEKRGQLTSLVDRQKHAQWVCTAVALGARQDKACDVIGLSTRTLQRWRIEGEIGADKRPTATRPEPRNKLSKAERHAVIDVCNSEEFASLPPSQIVPILANRGEYFAAELSFYRVLHAQNMLITEAKLSREMSIKSQQVIRLKKRTKCGVGISATGLQM